MSFDLSQVKEKHTDEAWLDIMNPLPDFEGEKTGIRIRVASPDSKIFRDAESAISDKSLAKLFKRRGGNMGSSVNAESLEKSKLELLLAITLDWEGVIYAGQELTCTLENKTTLYTEPSFRFIREQVDSFVGDRRNFFGN